VVDTLRAKSLSLLGYGRETSPNLARFARDAITYENAITPGTWTVPSHASLFTGLWPSFHGAERVAADRILATPINPKIETLAERLRRSGWATGAFVANTTYLTPSLGFDRGFDAYVTDGGPADVVGPAALRWLAQQRGHAFLFVNLLDPHEPYLPRQPYDTRFPGKNPELGDKITDLYWKGKPLTADVRRHFRSQYDGEIAFTDEVLADLFAQLREMGRYDDSLILLTSDHGEILGEHGLAGHGGAPYEELLHVPLLVKLPGSRGGGARVERRVSTMGVYATILAAAGVTLPDETQSVPLERPHPVWAEDVSFAGERVTVGYDGDRKLVHRIKPGADGAGAAEVFDLRADPREKKPADASAASGLAASLETFRRTKRPRNEAPPPVVDPERERQLRELGYLH